MTHKILIVIGASGRIGREVARLGVAYGADVYGVTRHGRPDIHEPWVEGVRWVARDLSGAGALGDIPRGALVVAAPVSLSSETVSSFDRVVWVCEPTGVMAAGEGLIIATPGEIDDSPFDEGSVELPENAIRVEMLGMALLRAALDDDIPAILSHEDLLHLGDAVMLQSDP